MKDENTLYWLWLAEKCGIASKQFGRLMEKYQDPFDLYRLSDDEIEQLEEMIEETEQLISDPDIAADFEKLWELKLELKIFLKNLAPEKIKGRK